jgi:hypothetical protein
MNGESLGGNVEEGDHEVGYQLVTQLLVVVTELLPGYVTQDH